MIRESFRIERGSFWEAKEGFEQFNNYYSEDIVKFDDSQSPPCPRRMDVSVCCLPTAAAGSGAQHPQHPVTLSSTGQPTIQTTSYQYTDQIVPERGHTDDLTVLTTGTSQDNWQHVSSSSSSSSTVPNATSTTTTTTTNTTAYIDYSWLQMQVTNFSFFSSLHRKKSFSNFICFNKIFFKIKARFLIRRKFL